jgi:hypothetical protein
MSDDSGLSGKNPESLIPKKPDLENRAFSL